jgi:hypothetical protein
MLAQSDRWMPDGLGRPPSHQLYQQRQLERARSGAAKRMLAGAKGRAKELGLPFDLTIADIAIPDVCPALGCRITCVGKRTTASSASLDRIVPDCGYVRGNVSVISLRANRLKGNATLQELESLTAYVRNAVAGHGDNVA